MEIITAKGKLIATATPDGRWTWVNRALAPPGFADFVDRPELSTREGGLVKGVLGTKLLAYKRGTPEWLGLIHQQIANNTTLEWRD